MSLRARRVVDEFMASAEGVDGLADRIVAAIARGERAGWIECRAAALEAVPDRFGAGWGVHRAVRAAINAAMAAMGVTG
jgi:uncharacterized Ntn-hydrolase superfamily protein